MRYRIFSIIATIFLGSCQTLFGQAGSSGFSFLKLGVGGRALGMGEAYSAAAADVAATYYNPAALSSARSSQLLLMHKEWIQDTKTEYIGAITSWNDFSFGVSANATSVNEIQIRERPGPPLGTFTARNSLIGVSASYLIDTHLSIGVTGKFLYEKILVDAASGYALDLGGLYQTPWDIRLAFVVSNLGSTSELDRQSSKLPAIIRFGGAYETSLQNPTGSLTFSSDIVSFSGEDNIHLHFGSEFNYKGAFALRAGYQTGYDAKSFSGGIGVHYGSIYVDYAYVPFKFDLGSTHTFSLGFEFQ